MRKQGHQRSRGCVTGDRTKRYDPDPHDFRWSRGVDKRTAEYAMSNGIEFTEYLADWDKYGKRAGFVRNYVMVAAAEAVIAVWDGASPGTKHSIQYARSCGKQVFVHLHSAARVGKVAASATQPVEL